MIIMSPQATRAKLLHALQIAADEFFEMGRFLILGSRWRL